MIQRSSIAAAIVCLYGLIACGPSETKTNESLQQLTWSAQVAAIVYKNCTPCHRPGESGPFNLLSYADAVKKAKLIRFVTQTHYMPPWPADPAYTHFLDERVLSDKEINAIGKWVDAGTPRGDSATEPAPPKFYAGSFFRKPDLVIRFIEAIPIKGNGQDAFLVVKMPYSLDMDTVVDFAEFVPGQRKLVHHVNGHLVSYDANRKFDYTKGSYVSNDTRAQVLKVYNDMHLPYTDGKVPGFPSLMPNTVYYLPGYVPLAYPEDVGGFRLKKNGLFLFNNIHYGPSNKDLLDSSYINVFFRKTPIKRGVTETQMGTFGISAIEPEFIIPPNQIKTFHTQSTVPYNISLLSVNPHMHLVGKTFLAYAIRPSGDTVPLIRINKWNFRWQYYYTYPHPVKLEKGTVIHVYGTFDNTAANPDNPFKPPRTITQGNGIESMKTTEEMFQFIFTFMPYRPGDEKIDLKRKW